MVQNNAVLLDETAIFEKMYGFLVVGAALFYFGADSLVPVPILLGHRRVEPTL